MNLGLRTMQAEDIEEVLEIEKEAFSPLWPGTSFKRQLSNRYSSYLVAYDSLVESQVAPIDQYEISRREGPWLETFFHAIKDIFKNPSPDTQSLQKLAGYVGVWFQGNEAHITEIAVREGMRGRGIGELLLIGSIRSATKYGSTVVTLEVRVSNFIAQRLYEKYGFSTAGIRKGYYSDNREDALIMTTSPIHTPDYQSQFDLLQQAYTDRGRNIYISE